MNCRRLHYLYTKSNPDHSPSTNSIFLQTTSLCLLFSHSLQRSRRPHSRGGAAVVFEPILKVILLLAACDLMATQLIFSVIPCPSCCSFCAVTSLCCTHMHANLLVCRVRHCHCSFFLLRVAIFSRKSGNVDKSGKSKMIAEKVREPPAKSRWIIFVGENLCFFIFAAVN